MLYPPTSRSRRHVRAVALTVALSLSPVFLPATVTAQNPATTVVGVERGDSGEAVRLVQQALLDRGFSLPGGADGEFGAGTESALMSFQASIGLYASGVVDTATGIALGITSNPFVGLSRGDSGPKVMDLQQQLGFAGVTVEGDVVGRFGAGTEAAVETFQRQVGVSASGSVDAATAAALAGASVRPVRPSESAPPAPPDPTEDAAGDEPPASPGDESDGIDEGAAADDGALRKPIDADATGDDPSIDAPVDMELLVGLRIGARGAAVRELQELLIEAGFSLVGGADGVFGVITANAVRSFQFANGLPETGEVDRATAEALVRDQADADGPDGPDDPDDDPDAEHDPTETPSSSLEGLRFGSVGADVRALQEALMAIGIDVRGGADGRFGSVTLAAVKIFQERVGLPQTGEVDRATAEALTAATREAPYIHLLGLEAGAVGNTVRELQQLLIDLGVTVRGGADGIFGPATAAAVREFQRSQGLEETGRIDRATLGALARPVAPQPLAGADDDHDDHDDHDPDDDDHDHDDDDHDHDDHDHGVAEDPDGGWAEYGERGERVIALQQALVDAGIPLTGGVDGIFGGATSAAVMEFQRRNNLPVTGRVDRATADELGLDAAPEPAPAEPASFHIETFPMQGPCHFTDTWGAPRSGGRTHQGTDIIGASGLELYAASDGTITKIYEASRYALAGNGIRLTMDDGTYFFYAHMTHVADGLTVGSRVEAGDLVGYNGDTGNAGTAHLHFEIHPQGGAAINPYPYLLGLDGC